MMYSKKINAHLFVISLFVFFQGCVKPIEMTGKPVIPILKHPSSVALCTNKLTHLTAEQLLKNDCKFLDTEKFSVLVQSAIYTEKLVLWKGANEGVLISAQGEPLKIRFSVYGGFFKVEGMSGFFMILPENKAAWHVMLGTVK